MLQQLFMYKMFVFNKTIKKVVKKILIFFDLIIVTFVSSSSDENY